MLEGIMKQMWLILIISTTALFCTGCRDKNTATEQQTEYSIYSNQLERTTEESSGQIVEAATTTGDVFEVTINNKKTNVISYAEDENTITVSDKNGRILQTGNFLSAKRYKEYYEYVKDHCTVIQPGEDANIKYIYYSYQDEENDTIYEALGWIIGSNSGFVINGYGEQEDVLDIFTDLYFKVKETDQENEYYVYDPQQNM